MDEIFKHAIEQAVSVAVPLVVSALVAGIGFIGKSAFTLLGKKIKESKTKLDDYLAGVAVKWAEDKYGKGHGQEKLDAATDWLIKNSKNKLTEEQAESLVRASYQSIFGNLNQLKNA